MAARSQIEWTDATVNFWWGCTKVGPGCDHCYAETWDRRTGGAHWGLNAPRRKIESAKSLLHRLDNQYAEWAADATCAVENAKVFGLPVPNLGTTRRVFIQSMSDLFDLEVDVEWFNEAWTAIRGCSRLGLQIVTKRISAVEKRLTEVSETEWPEHAGLMITVVNQVEADRDIPRLLALKGKLGIPWVGLSCEPLLGPIDLTRVRAPVDPDASDEEWLFDALSTGDIYEQRFTNSFGETWFDTGDGPYREAKLDWVIVGGESGRGARSMHPAWARSLRDQCAHAGVPFFFKQWGEWRPSTAEQAQGNPYSGWQADRAHPHVAKAEELYPENGAAFVERVGKKAAGRLLDGVEHNAMPEALR